MDVLIVGSIAYDSLESPEGKSDDELGGSATYSGFSAAFHSQRLEISNVGIVGVVGNDFLPKDLDLFVNAGLDIGGIEEAEGSTFRWKGSYHGDMATAQTHETKLNVLENFQPKIPPNAINPKVLFCANLHPDIQLSVLKQTNAKRLVALDSMNLWINIAKSQLIKVMNEVDIIVLNEEEICMLANNDDLISASKSIREITGNPIVVIKRGKHGVMAMDSEGHFSLPSFPVSRLVDPTGCGDSFAGAMVSFLSKGEGQITRNELVESLIHATVTASFTLESFGTESLRALKLDNYESRLIDYQQISNIR